jgi:hypothetical protein
MVNVQNSDEINANAMRAGLDIVVKRKFVQVSVRTAMTLVNVFVQQVSLDDTVKSVRSPIEDDAFTRVASCRNVFKQLPWTW